MITGILGPNGSGKSTTLHIITGLIKASSGTASIDGHTAESGSYRSAFGFCPDDLPQPDLLTAREYLEMVQGIRRLDVPLEALIMLLMGLHLETSLDKLIVSFSHGMKRKLQLVAALLHRPRLLILDEPFRGLDPESAAIMKQLVTSYARQGNAVLLSTHDLLVAEQLCDEVVVLREGKVVLSGDVDEILKSRPGETLEQSFLVATGLDASSEESAAVFFEGLNLINSDAS